MPTTFTINTHDLDRRPGSLRELQTTARAAERLGNEVIGIPAGDPIELELRLEAVSEGVLISGSAHALAVGECVRCLGPVRQEVDAGFTELFGYPDRRHQHEPSDQDAEQLPVLDGDLADVEGAVTDALVPVLPFQPLCAPDCQGLCSVCGIAMAQAEPGHAHELLDPRWDALAALLTDDQGPAETGDEDRPGHSTASGA
ncbi:MAG: YceD family protein [Beutenbergiaceae bacterium]